MISLSALRETTKTSTIILIQHCLVHNYARNSLLNTELGEYKQFIKTCICLAFVIVQHNEKFLPSLFVCLLCESRFLLEWPWRKLKRPYKCHIQPVSYFSHTIGLFGIGLFGIGLFGIGLFAGVIFAMMSELGELGYSI